MCYMRWRWYCIIIFRKSFRQSSSHSQRLLLNFHTLPLWERRKTMAHRTEGEKNAPNENNTLTGNVIVYIVGRIKIAFRWIIESRAFKKYACACVCADRSVYKWKTEKGKVNMPSWARIKASKWWESRSSTYVGIYARWQMTAIYGSCQHHLCARMCVCVWMPHVYVWVDL